MIELAIAVGLIAAPLAAALVTSLLPWETALAVGSWLVAVGLGFGVPAGVGYHLLLYRALRPAPRGWWLRPTALHGRLPAAARGAVLAWCYAGALGFVLALAGCALVAVGALRGR